MGLLGPWRKTDVSWERRVHQASERAKPSSHVRSWEGQRPVATPTGGCLEMFNRYSNVTEKLKFRTVEGAELRVLIRAR